MWHSVPTAAPTSRSTMTDRHEGKQMQTVYFIHLGSSILATQPACVLSTIQSTHPLTSVAVRRMLQTLQPPRGPSNPLLSSQARLLVPDIHGPARSSPARPNRGSRSRSCRSGKRNSRSPGGISMLSSCSAEARSDAWKARRWSNMARIRTKRLRGFEDVSGGMRVLLLQVSLRSKQLAT
ncbi:uncharacterized protein B0I36DRAFT_339381 [Microdochium trichocladiopsis]|uniref:Uncharacterized protein n=1 Tax=Microdochium trichocladiopsis TaxID=1682393 RepID=A0A9P8XQY6_9PEZI|nr:uncharacterized protein B0I36DRAFT_339381 [Microdochium trichocladiopsis]KAH7012481.1 hypothetical protein B0I36DRAFT_339381 [Microdochium trichocladiopsis]